MDVEGAARALERVLNSDARLDQVGRSDRGPSREGALEPTAEGARPRCETFDTMVRVYECIVRVCYAYAEPSARLSVSATAGPFDRRVCAHGPTIRIVLLELPLRPDLVLGVLVRRALGRVTDVLLRAHLLPLRLQLSQLVVTRTAIRRKIPLQGAIVWGGRGEAH